MAGKHRKGGNTAPVLEDDLAPDELAPDDDLAPEDEALAREPDDDSSEAAEADYPPEVSEVSEPDLTRPSAPSETRGAVLPGGPPTARRAVRAERRQRARRVRLGAMIVVAVLVVAAVAWTISSSRGGNSDTTNPPLSARTQQTLLLQVTDASGQTVAGVLLAHNRTGTGSGFGALVPSTLLVTVPGIGGMSFAATSTTAGAGPGTGPVAVADALGVTVDGGWKLSEAGFISLLNSVGGVDVTVDEDIQQSTSAGSVLLMHAGPQHLSGSQAAAYATFLDLGAPEQQRLARFSTVLTALAAKLPRGSAAISPLLSGLSSASASTLSPARLADFVEFLRVDATGGRLTFDNVPTHPLDSGGSLPTVVIDNTALPAFVKADFAGSVPTTPAGGPITVLVQNGVGTPGLDDKARVKLTAAGISFISGGNASSFANPTSTILIADGTDASRAQGALVARALGLPNSDLRITQQGQNLADVVVVLGDDFKP